MRLRLPALWALGGIENLGNRKSEIGMNAEVLALKFNDVLYLCCTPVKISVIPVLSTSDHLGLASFPFAHTALEATGL